MDEFKRSELIKIKSCLERLGAALEVNASLVPPRCKAKSHQIYGRTHMVCHGCMSIANNLLGDYASQARTWASQTLEPRGPGMSVGSTNLDAYLAQLNWCHQCCPKLNKTP